MGHSITLSTMGVVLAIAAMCLVFILAPEQQFVRTNTTLSPQIVTDRLAIGAREGPGTNKFYVRGNTYSEGSSTITDTLAVHGSIVVSQDLDVSNNAAIDGTLTVTGDVTAENDAEVANDLTVGRDAAIGRNTTVGGTANIAGVATMQSTAVMQGDATVAGDLTVAQDIAATGSITATSNVTGAIVTGNTALASTVVRVGAEDTDYALITNPLTGLIAANQSFPVPLLIGTITCKQTGNAYSARASDGGFVLGDSAASTFASVSLPSTDLLVETALTITVPATVTAGIVTLQAHNSLDSAIHTIVLWNVALDGLGSGTAVTNYRKTIRGAIPQSVVANISHFRVILTGYAGTGSVTLVYHASNTDQQTIVRLYPTNLSPSLTTTYTAAAP